MEKILQKHSSGDVHKKDVLENLAKLVKQLFWGLLFNKVADLRLVALFKKRLQRSCFSMNFGKYLGNFFSQVAASNLTSYVIKSRPGWCHAKLIFYIILPFLLVDSEINS